MASEHYSETTDVRTCRRCKVSPFISVGDSMVHRVAVRYDDGRGYGDAEIWDPEELLRTLELSRDLMLHPSGLDYLSRELLRRRLNGDIPHDAEEYLKLAAR